MARARPPDTEVALILSARARITDEDGSSFEVAEGEVLVLPRGWSGGWDVLVTLRKAYVIT